MKKAIFALVCGFMVLLLCSCSANPAIETFDVDQIFSQHFDAGVPYTFTIGEQEYTLSVAQENICTLLTTEVSISVNYNDTGATVISSIHYQYVGTYTLSDDASTLSARFDQLYISAEYESQGMSIGQLKTMELARALATYGNGEEYQKLAALLQGDTVAAPSSEFDYVTVNCTFSSDKHFFNSFRLEEYIDDTLNSALELSDERWLIYRYTYHSINSNNIDSICYTDIYNEDNFRIRSIVPQPDGSYLICEYEENGCQKEFFYDADGQLEREIHYDEQHHRIYEYYKGGSVYTYVYNGDTRVSENVYWSDGTSRTTYYGDNERCIKEEYYYDGQLTEIKDFFYDDTTGVLLETRSYDSNGNQFDCEQFDENGKSRYHWTISGDFMYEYHYELLTKTTFYNEDRTINAWYEYSYNDDGTMAASYSYEGDGTLWSWTIFSYENGEASSETFYSEEYLNRLESYTEYEEDGTYIVWTTKQGRVVAWYHYTAEGTLLDWREFDDDGNTVAGRITGEWTSDFGSGIRWWEYSNGLLIGDERYDNNGTLLYKYTYEYDSNGKLLIDRLYNGNGDLESYTEYNTIGRPAFSKDLLPDGKLQISEFTYDSNGILVYEVLHVYKADGALDHWYEAYYDSDGNMIKDQYYEG